MQSNDSPWAMSKSQKVYLIFKRGIDIFGSLFGILVLSPIILACAILTKATSPGPVFFRQPRTGLNQQPFRIYKFRSMKISAKQAAPSELSEEERADMVTGWGKFMRKTSLDEIPQLFNILIGDMSFIGPRPCTFAEEELLRLRNSTIPSAYLVKPGISGLAQIRLRRDHNPAKKAQYDYLYAKCFSFHLDAKLFLLSLLVALGFYKGK